MKDSRIVYHLFGLAGAAVGAVVGYFVFYWILQQGFYALALPGALLGLGCGLASRIQSNILAIVCGVAAAGLSIFSEWKVSPFIDDPSLLYFLTHLHQLDKPIITWIMIVIGTLCGAWFGRGREYMSFSRPKMKKLG